MVTGVQWKNLLAICLFGLGILQVDLGRGDMWEQFSHLHPKYGVK